MTQEHWLFLLAIALLLGLMLAFSLMSSPKSRGYRAAQRVFWAFLFLQGCSLLGWLGVNWVNLSVSAFLGWPGCAALLALAAI